LALTEISVNVHGAKGVRAHRLVVDTRSSYTWIDGRILKEIGVAAIGIEPFRTIDKRVIKREA